MDVLYFIKHYSHVLSGLNYLAMLAGMILLFPVIGRWSDQDLFLFLLVGLLAAYGLVTGVFLCFQKQRRSG